MTDPEHFTTISVKEYIHLKAVILKLRVKVQKARELLEINHVEDARLLLSKEEDELR
jgi:hypothetical protein